MIKNVLLPATIGNYYLFAQRILSFDIGKMQVLACQVYLTGRSITIEKTFQEPLEANAATGYPEKVAKAIGAIHAQADKRCVIYTALSSSVAVFKTLRLPFVDREKIGMVIGYEIEPLLPFSLQDALVDFIVTKESLQEPFAEVLVAAVQKTHIVQHLHYFTQAGIEPEKISIDMFDMYALYKKLPAYHNKLGGVALIDLGFSATTVTYIYHGQLRMIRTIAKGSSRQVKLLSDTLGLQPQEALEKLMRFGMGQSDNSAYQEVVTNIMTSFWQEIQFTLNSFAAKEPNALELLLLCGEGSEIKDVTYFATKVTGIACEQFSVSSLFATSQVYWKNKQSMPASFVQSLATALPSDSTQAVNFRQKEFAVSHLRLFKQQLIVGCLLCSMLFATLVAHYVIQVGKLSQELEESQAEIISTIKKHFKIPKDETTLDIVDYAKKEVKREMELWFAFSGQARSSVLKYLSDLQALDKEGLGLDVSSITINEGVLMLKARVKDYEALKKLEEDLRNSKLFSSVEPQEKTEFSMRINLVKNVED
jgi:type IV pilus assembly protein PilM